MEYWVKLPCAGCEAHEVSLKGGAASCLNCKIRRPELDIFTDFNTPETQYFRLYPKGSPEIPKT